LIRILKLGRQEPVNLIINYARRKSNLAATISKQIELYSNKLMALMSDSIVLQKVNMDSNNIISLFIPNTYNMYWNINSTRFMERMFKEYNSFWNSSRTTKSILLKMSPLQVATLASIVMSETNKVDEMPIIARAYLNRLKIGMPLQADPTIIFALNDTAVKRVLSIHTAINNPYNTLYSATTNIWFTASTNYQPKVVKQCSNPGETRIIYGKDLSSYNNGDVVTIDSLGPSCYEFDDNITSVNEVVDISNGTITNKIDCSDDCP
jgi:hypothetical protein